jgi:two-component system cell cycle response regulator
MREERFDEAVAVTRDIYWVGFYDVDAHLHCNPYLLIDDDEAVLFDPGSIPDFAVSMRKVIDLVKPSEISVVVASHQDPDVCGNLAIVEDVIDRPDLRIVAHSRTARLIRHLGIRSELWAPDEHGGTLTLKSGRALDFIPTPYLHAPGAMATLDRKTRSLFTSDLFGGLSTQWSLFARGDWLPTLTRWHQEYMPSGSLLRRCMERFETLEVERILPQHGSVLEGDQVREAIDYLKTLRCGEDLAQ